MSPKHSQDPISSVPYHIQTSSKSFLRKGASEGSDDHKVSHCPEVSHRQARKLVHSMPYVQQSPLSDKPITEQSLASSFLQRFSLADNAESFTQPNRSSFPCAQLYVPGVPVCKEITNKTTDLDRTLFDSTIDFSFHLDQYKLKVRLKNATDLPKEFRKNCLVQCDPFVMLHLEPSREDTFQSKVIKNTRNPVFDQTFQFGELSVQCLKRQTLVLRIYNHALNNKTFGKVYLPLHDVEFSGTFMRMKIVHSEEMEVYSLHVIICFSSFHV